MVRIHLCFSRLVAMSVSAPMTRPRLQVDYDYNGQNNLGYSIINPIISIIMKMLHGSGQSNLYASRTSSANNGCGYGISTSNSAAVGYSF
ncbi:MAG: hypothetical protein IPH20_23260 [Bacteroidales bacterium]|nr:hypothetical protein [Bacteroidales bacterium]